MTNNNVSCQTLTIAPAVFSNFPSLKIGYLRGSISQQKPNNVDQLEALKRTALEHLLASFDGNQALNQHPSALRWKEAYTKLGYKTKSKKPTHWVLGLRLLKDKAWPRPISPVVDTYLTNQVQHLLPHGGYDAESLKGGLRLDLSVGDEDFVGVGSDAPEPTSKNELVYRDDERILTRMWNYRDADATKLTEDTKEFMLFVEEVDPSDDVADALRLALEDLAERYRSVFEGEFKSEILEFTPENNVAQLSL